jgi:hypothetical protein
MRDHHEEVVEVDAMSKKSLADLGDLPRWVAWFEETRDGKKTKVPYNTKTGRRGSSNDPETWATREQANQLYAKTEAVGGVGVVLGELDDATWLMGIDLDRCRDSETGVLAPWATEIVERFNTYTEVSPSKQGVKAFFFISADDAQKVDELMDGKTRRAFAAGDHLEIALDRERYYAVTGERLESASRDIRAVSLEDVQWLLTETGPRFKGDNDAKQDQRHSRDESGSGYGFRFLRDRKVQGCSYQEAVAAIEADGGEAGEWARRSDGRQIRRAWDNCSASTNPHSWDDPDTSLLDDRRGDLPAFPLAALDGAQLPVVAGLACTRGRGYRNVNRPRRGAAARYCFRSDWHGAARSGNNVVARTCNIVGSRNRVFGIGQVTRA